MVSDGLHRENYWTKKEKSNQYLHSVYKGGLESLDYVKNVLNRNNTAQDETPITYVNPHDEVIKERNTDSLHAVGIAHLIAIQVSSWAHWVWVDVNTSGLC